MYVRFVRDWIASGMEDPEELEARHNAHLQTVRILAFLGLILLPTFGNHGETKLMERFWTLCFLCCVRWTYVGVGGG